MIIILGILAAIAVSKYVNLSSAARESALHGIKAAMDSTNNNLRAASFTGQFNIKTCPQYANERVKEIYLKGTPTAPNVNCNLAATRNNPDIVLMIYGWMDNDEIGNTLNISGGFQETSDTGSPWANTYLGYDLNNDGNVTNDNCYYHYQQPLNRGETPISEVVSSGC